MHIHLDGELSTGGRGWGMVVPVGPRETPTPTDKRERTNFRGQPIIVS